MLSYLVKEQLVAVDAVAGALVLDRRHDLELAAAARLEVAEDAELLAAVDLPSEPRRRLDAP